MKAKLFVRAMTEPIQLSEEEARVAQAFIADGAKTPDTPFVIEGVWAGKKADMRFVVFERKEEGNAFAKVDPMLETDVPSFEAEIEPYKAEALAKGFGPYYWREFWLQGKGALSLGLSGKSIQRFVKNAQLYKELDHKADTYAMHKKHKEFGEAKKLEGYDEMANQMSV